MFSIIKWHDAKKELPKESGSYLVVTTFCKSILVLDYSSKYQKFNARDNSEEEDVQSYALHVDYWAELPKAPKEK